MNPLAKIKSQSKSRPLRDTDFKYVHDLFMKEYGWISLEDMKNLPLPTLWNLYSIISERRRKEKEERDKLNTKKGRR